MLFPLDDQIECRFLYQLALSPAVSLIPRRPESARNPCTSRFWGWYTGCAAHARDGGRYTPAAHPTCGNDREE